MPIPSWIRTQRVLPLLLIGLSGCDAHDMSMAPDGAVADAASAACQLCKPNQKCVQDTCMDDPDRIWTLTVAAATIKDQKGGAPWDDTGGAAPDPFFSLRESGTQVCRSVTVRDTLTPQWTEGCSLPARQLFNNSKLELGMFDEDPPPEGYAVIAFPAMLIITPSALANGVFEVPAWDQLLPGSQVKIRLQPQ